MPTRPRKRRTSTKLAHFLFPHKKNAYKPHIFRTASVCAIMLLVVAFQAAYFAQVKLLFPKTNFLAAVLPGTLVDLTNSDRASNDVQPVTENATLDQAAQDAAEDMATKGYFSHVSPDGKDPWYWLHLVGFDYAYAGQNLAVNFTDSSQVETAWMNSPTHRENIVKPQYTEVGIGVANGMYEGKEATFVVQFFASPGVGSAGEGSGQAPVQTAPAESSGSGEIAVAPKTTGVAVTREQTVPSEAVLGAQTQQTQKNVATPSQAKTGTPQAVTGASGLSASSKAPSGLSLILDDILTSPTHTYLYILTVLAAFVLTLLIIEFLVKARMQYVEVTGGGLVLLVFLIAAITFTVAGQSHVQVAAQGQSAAVVTSGV